MGIISNFGTIDAPAGTGILFQSSAAGGTVTNAGTITGGGGTAIQFGSGAERLIIDPGAVFAGTVIGGSGSNTLEFASATSAGTLSGLGTSFTNFGSIVVDDGATWTLTGTNTLTSGAISMGSTSHLTIAGSLHASPGLLLQGGTLALGGSTASSWSGAPAPPSQAGSASRRTRHCPAIRSSLPR